MSTIYCILTDILFIFMTCNQRLAGAGQAGFELEPLTPSRTRVNEQEDGMALRFRLLRDLPLSPKEFWRVQQGCQFWLALTKCQGFCTCGLPENPPEELVNTECAKGDRGCHAVDRRQQKPQPFGLDLNQRNRQQLRCHADGREHG